MHGNVDRPYNLGSGADIDVPIYNGGSRNTACPDGHLLENQTIYSNLCIGMNDDPIWMRNKKTTSNPTVQRNVGASNHAPKLVTNNSNLSHYVRFDTSTASPMLIAPDCE